MPSNDSGGSGRAEVATGRYLVIHLQEFLKINEISLNQIIIIFI